MPRPSDINQPLEPAQVPMDSVPELLEAVRRRRWILAASVLVALALAGLYVLQAEPIYEVHARVLVQRQSLPHQEQRDLRRDEGFLATQAEILSSPAVVTAYEENPCSGAGDQSLRTSLSLHGHFTKAPPKLLLLLTRTWPTWRLRAGCAVCGRRDTTRSVVLCSRCVVGERPKPSR